MLNFLPIFFLYKESKRVKNHGYFDVRLSIFSRLLNPINLYLKINAEEIVALKGVTGYVRKLI